MTLKPEAMRPQTQQIRQNEKTVKYVTDKATGKKQQCQINEEEISDLLEKEFEVIIVKTMENVRNRMEAWIEKIQEMINK